MWNWSRLLEWFRGPRQVVPSIAPTSFIYVSTSKVEMLEQSLKQSLANGLAFKGSGGIPGIFNVEAAQRDLMAGRYKRALKVCAQLEAEGRVGSYDSDSQYFRAELIMVWGFWNRRDKTYADVVFFSGFPDPDSIVCIGGSAYHTMERDGQRLQEYSNSGIQQLMQFMNEQSIPGPAGRSDLPDAWPAEALDADHDNPLVPERVEFVAERLRDVYEYNTRIILGSPIYVARTSRILSQPELKEYNRLREQEIRRIFGRPRLQPYHPGTRWQVGKYSDPMLPPVDDPIVPPERGKPASEQVAEQGPSEQQ